MDNRFEITDRDGDTLAARAATLRDGTPILAVRITEYGDDGSTSSAVAHVPTARLEEVIAGLRDTARQAGARTAPLKRREQDAAEVLRIVSSWYEDVNDGLGVDASDLVAELERVGYTLPDDGPDR